MKKTCLGLTIILFSLIFVLCGCSDESEEKLEKNKINSELEYLESRILFIENQYFNGEYYNDENNLKWEEIEEDFSLITKNKSIIIMDLASKQIDGNTILDFENNIIYLGDAISNKNIQELFKNLCQLYSFIPEFSKQLSYDEDLTKIRNIKSNLLYANYCVIINEFEAAKSYVENIENIYGELIQSKSYLEKNSFLINRKYIEIESYKIAIENQNLEAIINSYFEVLSFI